MMKGVEMKIFKDADDRDEFTLFGAAEFLMESLSHGIGQSELFNCGLIDHNRGGRIRRDLR